MLEYLNNLDHQLLLFLNSKHSPLWDEIMLKTTDRFFWVPFYALLVLFLIWKFRKTSWLILLTIIVATIASDQFSSSLMKPLFERFRPCHDESISHILRLIDGCGGQYGFISSHASNTFALCTFLTLLLKKQYKWIFIIYLWAILISYSRIYLGKHFPGDIIAGAIAGIIISFLFYRLYIWLNKKIFTKADLI